MIRTLLYVDDDADIRTIVGMALELDGGFAPVLADGGAQALELIAGGLQPDVVVLDVMMPGMDGLTLLDHLRPLLSEGVPVLFMTAKGRQADRALYLQRGAIGVLVKPFDPVRLGADILAVIEDRRSL
jgi:two-component system OmpR family response regulator